MGHNGSEDTCLHQTDAQGLHSVELKELDHLVANSSIPRSSGTDHNLFVTHNEYKQAQANIYLHKNITSYKIKYYKSKQYKMESASTVTRGKEPR